MTLIDDLAEVIRDRYSSASVSVKHFPSGPSTLDIVFHDKLFVVEHRPGEGYGLSLVEDDEGLVPGHQWVFPDLSSMAARLWEELELASGPERQAAVGDVAEPFRGGSRRRLNL